MAVKYKALPPFVWQGRPAMDLVRHCFDGRERTYAIAIYQALSTLANDERGMEFEASRAQIADLSGVTDRTIDRYTDTFQRVGLLEVERQAGPGGEKIPHRYLILDPPTHAKPVQEGGEAASPPHANGLRIPMETVQEVQQEGEEGKALAADAADGVLPGFDPPAEPAKPTTGWPAEEEEVWREYLDVFGSRVRQRELTDPRRKMIRKGLRASGADSDIRVALDLCKRAIHGLQSYRQAHPRGSSDVSISVIFSTNPTSKSNLTDQIEWWAAQANQNTGGHGDRMPLDLVGVPPVTAGAIHQRRREVANMVSHPDSEEYREVGERAAATLRERYSHEYVVEDGRIRWRFVGDT